MVKSGARDGVTAELEETVDGLSFGTSLGILKELKDAFLKYLV